MDTALGQETFEGDPEDLEAFLQLVESPIRNQRRTDALAEWRAYKQAKLESVWRRTAPDAFRPSMPQVVVLGQPPPSTDPSVEEGAPRRVLLAKGWNILAMKQHLIDLSGANLEGICVGYVDLRGVKLDGACLRGASLKGAEMEWASLRDADLRGARLLQADLSQSQLQGADLRDADLTHVNLVGANLEGADLRGSRIYGVSAWDVSLCEDESKRQDLILTPPDGTEVRVDDLEVAQFLYLILNRRKLRNVINAVTQRGVLILGRFRDGGLELLQDIARWLRQPANGGYLPMLFDFPRPDAKTYSETVRTLAGLSRFAIVELSGASVPQEITATVDLYKIPFVAVAHEELEEWSMFKDFLINDRVIGPIRFADRNDLLARLSAHAIDPAEKMIEDRQRKLSEIFAPQEGPELLSQAGAED